MAFWKTRTLEIMESLGVSGPSSIFMAKLFYMEKRGFAWEFNKGIPDLLDSRLGLDHEAWTRSSWMPRQVIFRRSFTVWQLSTGDHFLRESFLEVEPCRSALSMISRSGLMATCLWEIGAREPSSTRLSELPDLPGELDPESSSLDRLVLGEWLSSSGLRREPWDFPV